MTQKTPLAEAARRHMFDPAASLKTLGQKALPRLDRAEGIYVVDEHGHRLIDGPAGMWCTQVGYNRREIADAMAEQAMNLSYTSPWYMGNSPAIRLAEKIASLTPSDLNRVFFTTGGSTAVDSALRFVEFRNNVRGLKDKKGVIVQIDGYHGSTALTAACSGRFGGATNFDVENPRIHFISSPNPRRFPGQSEAEICDFLVNEFRETVEKVGPGNIAAFLTEPLLASGGMILPPKGYHAGIKAICEAHDIVYISDEVVTGFGRLGEWFALESVFGVTPDIVTFAKGLTSGYVPLGGLAISDRLIDNISGDNAHGAFFGNGYTYSGHPVSCAAALANIAIFEDEDLLGHVHEIAPYFEAQLKSLEDLPTVVEVRTQGLLGCVECMVQPGPAQQIGAADRALGEKIDRYAFEKGLIVRPLGNMCVLSPPLVITRAQIDEMVAILRAAILQAAEELAEAA